MGGVSGLWKDKEPLVMEPRVSQVLVVFPESEA